MEGYDLRRSRLKMLLANNNSNIPAVTLRNIMRILETRSDEIITRWIEYFGEAKYYC